MMQDEPKEPSNICPQCGGVINIFYTIEFLECRPRSIRVDPQPMPSSTWTLCPGHPEPAVKHDGNLDGRGQMDYLHASVEHRTWYGADEIEAVSISGGYGDIENSHVVLDPKQALSLLIWLTQEKPTLEKLAKEQEP